MAHIMKNEHTILARRKHWFVLVSDLIGPAILALLPFVVYFFIEGQTISVGTQVVTLSLDPLWFTYLGSIWLLLFWMFIVGTWIDYYLDIWMITDKHLIDREQKGFFDRETSVFRIERIQDVTISTRGILPTLLHFGDIHVQTAGEAQEFIMRGIANPQHVREIILKTQNQILEEQPHRRDSEGTH